MPTCPRSPSKNWPELGLDQVLDMLEKSCVIANEMIMCFPCLLVPGTEVGPLAEEARLIDLALLGDDEIRLLEDAILRQALQGLAPGCGRC